MKHALAVLTSLLVLAVLSPSALAQQNPRFGLGVGLSSGAIGGGGTEIIESYLSPASIYVPITFTTFRLEPEIGIFRVSQESGDFSTSSTLFQLGTGVFILRPEGNTAFYYGARVGITRLSSSTDTAIGENESSSLNFFVGPATGGEYFFSDNFSLGGEGQLIFTSVGDDDDDEDDSTSILRTRAIFFFRWYF